MGCSPDYLQFYRLCPAGCMLLPPPPHFTPFLTACHLPLIAAPYTTVSLLPFCPFLGYFALVVVLCVCRCCRHYYRYLWTSTLFCGALPTYLPRWDIHTRHRFILWDLRLRLHACLTWTAVLPCLLTHRFTPALCCRRYHGKGRITPPALPTLPRTAGPSYFVITTHRSLVSCTYFNGFKLLPYRTLCLPLVLGHHTYRAPFRFAAVPATVTRNVAVLTRTFAAVPS